MTNKIRHITESQGYEPRTDSIYVALPGERYTPFSLGKKLGARTRKTLASSSTARKACSSRKAKATFSTPSR